PPATSLRRLPYTPVTVSKPSHPLKSDFQPLSPKKLRIRNSLLPVQFLVRLCRLKGTSENVKRKGIAESTTFQVLNLPVSVADSCFKFKDQKDEASWFDVQKKALKGVDVIDWNAMEQEGWEEGL
ncbi:hypothetical protein LINGRAHAP2_LOCUS4654, partial [Linum grandiflorum]